MNEPDIAEHLHAQRLQQQIIDLKNRLAIAQEHNIIIENSFIWRALRRFRRLKTSYMHQFKYKYKHLSVWIKRLFKQSTPIALPPIHSQHDLSVQGQKTYDILKKPS